ncbi:MAG: ArsR family transcriptional regulator [Thermoplasmata archaeon]|jgi:predicted DNA-binding ArsR family transcriptional regulator|nr:ArsR family transcriptional regulator [Thermoplasmata archaeon]MVT13160.1 ArsR family transcriptional regulator [Euryarchaeota archaeon]MVT13926.1 ArsR family transcriptional regulator [Euryarchaeota archaeon]MVT35494.1 ArsR family transcriptional regulator [Euryarchaeota archaeon]
MSKIKAINDSSDMVAIFHTSDTEIKKNLFLDLISNWMTIEEIEKKYGEEGKRALFYLEKIKLVESQWTIRENGQRTKSYKAYYDTVQINITMPIVELPEIIRIATMSDEEIYKYEETILKIMGDKKSIFLGDVQSSLNVSLTFLKGIIKRSSKFEIRGHDLERVEL